MPTPRYLLIANPGTKRCEIYSRELLAFWAERGVAPELEVVPWADVVPRDGNLDELPAFDQPAIVRLESPGKDEHVTRLMLEAGACDESSEPSQWRTAEMTKGRLLRPGLWYRGFRRVLCGLRHAFNARPHLSPTACPVAIAEMFDKTQTTTKLHAAGVPVPNWLKNPRDIFAQMGDETSRWQTGYLKLNTGSSATGIIAIRANGTQLHGITTLAEVDGRFFNSRRLVQLTDAPLERAAEFLLSEGAFAQEGIPMAQIDGQNFDLRVVCIHGEPAATIFRLSSAPMTNLHLGGRRGNHDHCRAAIPTREWLDALDHCADAAGCFDSVIGGVDVVFERGFSRHYVLEVNAFGDFFPGWTDAHGRSVHARELAETARRLE